MNDIQGMREDEVGMRMRYDEDEDEENGKRKTARKKARMEECDYERQKQKR